MLRLITDFWEEVMEKDPNVDTLKFQTYLQTHIPVPKIPHTVPLSLNDTTIEEAINKINQKSSPGTNAIDGAILNHMPKDLKKLYIDIVKKIYSSHDVPHKWRQSIVMLFQKKGNPNFCNNYRPIALQQTDMKPLTNVISSTHCNLDSRRTFP